jgi:hypothetical protein
MGKTACGQRNNVVFVRAKDESLRRRDSTTVWASLSYPTIASFLRFVHVCFAHTTLYFVHLPSPRSTKVDTYTLILPYRVPGTWPTVHPSLPVHQIRSQALATASSLRSSLRRHHLPHLQPATHPAFSADRRIGDGPATSLARRYGGRRPPLPEDMAAGDATNLRRTAGATTTPLTPPLLRPRRRQADPGRQRPLLISYFFLKIWFLVVLVLGQKSCSSILDPKMIWWYLQDYCIQFFSLFLEWLLCNGYGYTWSETNKKNWILSQKKIWIQNSC